MSKAIQSAYVELLRNRQTPIEQQEEQDKNFLANLYNQAVAPTQTTTTAPIGGQLAKIDKDLKQDLKTTPFTISGKKKFNSII